MELQKRSTLPQLLHRAQGLNMSPLNFQTLLFGWVLKMRSLPHAHLLYPDWGMPAIWHMVPNKMTRLNKELVVETNTVDPTSEKGKIIADRIRSVICFKFSG